MCVCVLLLHVNSTVPHLASQLFTFSLTPTTENMTPLKFSLKVLILSCGIQGQLWNQGYYGFRRGKDLRYLRSFLLPNLYHICPQETINIF